MWDRRSALWRPGRGKRLFRRLTLALIVTDFTSVVPEISIVVPVNSIVAIVFTGITLEFMGAVSLVPIVVNIIYLAVFVFLIGGVKIKN